ncbi:hypothetical protein KR018_011318, partial [Drosophila ironensis]
STMAFAEDPMVFVKQVALDWRELVREKKNMMLMSPSMSIMNQESLADVPVSRLRASSMLSREKRESSFYRANFPQKQQELTIERREGSMNAARILVNETLNLYVYPPIHVTPEARESLLLYPTTPVSVMSS